MNIISEYENGRRDFRGANLSRANLSEAYLGGANLSGANLSGANLSEAYLGGANLREANLHGADLGGANLREANLHGADLGGAYLGGAYLREANLRGADLGGADLGGANLSGANFSGVKGLSTKDQEIQILKFIKDEIISKSLLDMSHWHTNWEWGNSLCGTTHCAAGSAQVWASLNGLDEYAHIEPRIVGSMLIPSVAHLFYASNNEFVAYLNGILAGDIPLLDR